MKARARNKEGSPVRILVVEDERKVAKALQKDLEGQGNDVAVAYTGE